VLFELCLVVLTVFFSVKLEVFAVFVQAKIDYPVIEVLLCSVCKSALYKLKFIIVFDKILVCIIEFDCDF
jgi:hypothetical protein